MNRVDAYWTFVESRRVGLISFIGEGGLEAVKEVESETMKCFEESVVVTAFEWCEKNKMDLRFVYEFSAKPPVGRILKAWIYIV